METKLILLKTEKKPTDLLNPPHKIKEPIKEKHAEFSAINFNNRVSRDETNNNNKIPIIGNSNT